MIGTRCSGTTKVYFPSILVQFTTHLNNNTPAIAEVLWGGGLWWGLRAKAPRCQQLQQITRGDNSVSIDVLALALHAAPRGDESEKIGSTNQSITRDVTNTRHNATFGFTGNTDSKKEATRVLAILLWATDAVLTEAAAAVVANIQVEPSVANARAPVLNAHVATFAPPGSP